MITQEIKIPQTLNDITLDKWLTWQEVDKDSEADFINRRALTIFFDIRADHYNKMKFSDVEYLITILNNLFEAKTDLQQTFTMNGVEYGLIPNFDDMTFGEFIDLDKYSANKDRHRLMSILYRPVVKKSRRRYRIEKYKGSSDIMMNMPLGVMLGCVAFFLTIGDQLLTATLRYMEKENPEEWKRVLEKSGDGIQALIHSRGGLFGDMGLLRNLM